MGEFDVRGAELKKLLKSAEKAPIAFAYSVGKSPKDDYFGVDKRKPPKVLFKKAQEEGPNKKVAFGTALVKDKALCLTCEREVPSLAEKLKKYLKTEKVGLDVRIQNAEDGSPAKDASDKPPEDAAKRAPREAAGSDTITVATDSPADDEEFAEDPDNPDDEDDVAAQKGDIKRLIAAARKKPYFVAALVGGEGIVLKAHRRKPPQKLVIMARKEGATTRGAWGSMRVAGKTLTITCEERPPKSLAKKIKQLLMSHKQALKVVCCLASGEIVDSADDEEMEGSASEQDTDMANQPSDAKASKPASMDAVKGMKADMMAAAKSHAYAKGYLSELFTGCIAAAKGVDPDAAARKIGQLERALAATKAAPLDGAQLDGLVAGIVPSIDTAASEFSRIVDLLNPVLTTDHPKRPAVESSVTAYETANAAEDTSGVLSAIGELRRHEATIEDVGHKIGEGGAVSQPLTDETANWLSSMLASKATS